MRPRDTQSVHASDNMAAANITVIGGLLMDHIFFVDRMPSLGETLPAKDYMKAPGGKGANAAIATYRAWHKNSAKSDSALDAAEKDISVRMVGAVGNDSEGDFMLDAIKQSFVDTSRVRVEANNNTGKAFVVVEQTDGNRDNRIILTPGANLSLEPGDFTTVERLSKCVRPDLIISQLELDLKTVEQILATAARAGIKVLLNAAPANKILPALYRHVTHLVVNETEAAMLSGRELAEVHSENFRDIAN